MSNQENRSGCRSVFSCMCCAAWPIGLLGAALVAALGLIFGAVYAEAIFAALSAVIVFAAVMAIAIIALLLYRGCSCLNANRGD